MAIIGTELSRHHYLYPSEIFLDIPADDKNDFVKARKHLTDSLYSQGIFEFETEEKIEERKNYKDRGYLGR